MSEKSFIVPHDFTPVADIALEHAIATAKPLNAEVQLVHVVSKENQIHEANQKLDSIVEKYASSGVKIVANVRLGNIFEDIGDFALEHEAELIFMGTHGAHGWQHVTGSHALKVVTNSSVPFIIVQEKGTTILGISQCSFGISGPSKRRSRNGGSSGPYYCGYCHATSFNSRNEWQTGIG